MALTFSSIEALKFGNITAVPQMNAEQRLRVRNLDMKEENVPEIIDTLAACFGDKSAEVKEFMTKNLFLMDFIQIQIYLTQGQTGLDALNARLDKFMDKRIDGLVAAEVAEKEIVENAQ